MNKVFEPIAIGSAEIPNRVVRSAHGTFIGRGVITDELIAYHAERAKGGVGLSFLEFCSPHPSSATICLNSWDDSIIAGYRGVAAAVKPYGMRMFQQIAHGGIMYPDADGVAWSSSATPSPNDGKVPVAMSRDMIAEVAESYGIAAGRCQLGGLDGVELHSGHGYLIHQFLSPNANRREDEYGGSFDNRLRFLREALRACRRHTSGDFPIGIRLSDEGAVGGLTADDCAQIVGILEQAGEIDYIHGSRGSYYSQTNMITTMEYPLGAMLPSSGKVVKGARRIPRILVAGRVRTLEEADQLLRDDAADLIVMNRALIADPALVNKTRDGRIDQVRPCIACNQGCVGGMMMRQRIGCAVNPAVGKEETLSEDLIVATREPKRVLIVGGGPAGMEAARTAALSGHKVTLLEAGPVLGGSVNIARLAPRLHGLADVTSWLESEIYRLGVDVRTNNYVETDDVLAEQADAVIVATGSLPRMDGIQALFPGQPIAGVDLPHVTSTIDLITSPKSRELPKTALVFDDVGNIEVIETAEWLVARGVAVTFVTRFTSVAPTVEAWLRLAPALEFLHQGDFRAIPRAQLVEIRAGECVIRPIESQKTETVQADMVVLGLSRTPINELHEALKGRVPVLRLIGDALTPRDIQEAIREGHLAGRFLFEPVTQAQRTLIDA
jgi:2,4-dienoyl-CoA reductase-like NADH-dependent reductase (Old Yellow Enzyme family)/pyruvate/2-oxoglutarate dehydrogenase complex dihydrolipoamide dehydrogenase (E3) component